MNSSAKNWITWAGFIGIVIAGGLFGLLLGLCISGVTFVDLLFGNSNASMEIWAPRTIWLIVASPIGGMCYAAFFGLLCLSVVAFFNWTVSFYFQPVSAAGISGGLTAFLCVVPYIVSVPRFLDWWQYAILFFLAPATAIILGTIIPMHFALRSLEQYYKDHGTVRDLGKTEVISGQFVIRNLFVVITWSGVLTGIAQGLGLLTTELAIVCIAFLIAQTISTAFCKMIFSKRYGQLPTNRKPEILFLKEANEIDALFNDEAPTESSNPAAAIEKS